MKNNYVTDISDYGKYGLLRDICKNTNLRLGINWYLTETDTKHQRKDKYLSFEKYELQDKELFCALKKISLEGKFLIESVQQSKILPDNTIYFDEILREEISFDERRNWHGKAIDKLQHSDIVFLDPDNGLMPKTRPKIKDRIKYVLYSEIAEFLQRGKSVICFQYRHRPADVTGAKSLLRYTELVDAVSGQGITDVQCFAVTFEMNIPEGAIAVDYLLFIKKGHNNIIEVCKKFERTSWSGVMHILGELD